MLVNFLMCKRLHSSLIREDVKLMPSSDFYFGIPILEIHIIIIIVT